MDNINFITVALNDMSRMENIYAQLKNKETQLEADLAIFNLKYVKLPEFNIKKVRNILILMIIICQFNMYTFIFF